MLWAGNGITLIEGNKTVHDYDAISGATAENRHAIPYGYGIANMNIYVLLKSGAYEYLPENHNLKFISDKNIIEEIGSGGENAYGVIILAIDNAKMPKQISKDMKAMLGHMAVGSASQNIAVAGAAYGVQTLTQIYFEKDKVIEALNIDKNIELLMILPFGYSKTP